MKKFNVENSLAVLGAVVVLVGVFFAAEDALAGSQAIERDDPVRLPARVVEKDNPSRQASMAEEAAAELKKDVRLSLDIQLRAHNSTVRAVRQ